MTSPGARPRILLVEVNEDGTVGGSHRGLADLALGMRASPYEPVVLFYQPNRYVASLQAAGVEVRLYDDVRATERRIRATGGRVARLADAVRAIGRRRSLLRAWNIALVHMNNSPAVGYDDWLPAARLAGIPCITFAMGDAELPSARDRWGARRFDHIIAISEYMHRAVLGFGVRPERVSLAALGVDPVALHQAVGQDRSSLRRSLGVSEDAVLVVMVGNIREWKGQRVLVEAVGMLPPTCRARAHVLLVGHASDADRAYEASLRARIGDLGLGDQVILTGPRSDVPSILSAADIAVHASTMAEPFGLVVPEAMAFGLPVIASRFGGPGEVLDASSGLHFDPSRPRELADHLARLIADPALRARLGEGARRRVEHYSVRAMVQVILGVYERLLRVRVRNGTGASRDASTPRLEGPTPHPGVPAGGGRPGHP
jgi:glycosyltransferase involved in cell wall biosynthesis